MNMDNRNIWGGEDYRGEVGIARSTLDDGETTVHFLMLSGKGEAQIWQARFSATTPASVIDGTFAIAKKCAEGDPAHRATVAHQT